MALFYSYISIIEPREFQESSESLYEELSRAKNLYNSKEFKKAHEIFDSLGSKYSENLKYQIDYVNFLLSIGDYDAIEAIDSNSETVNSIKASAKEYSSIIKSGNVKKIANLISVSPNNYTVLISSIKDYLASMQQHNFMHRENFFISNVETAKILSPNNPEPYRLLGNYYILRNEPQKAINKLRDQNASYVLRDFESLYNEYVMVAKISDLTRRFEDLKKLNLNVKKKAISDSYNPSIYTYLEMKILDSLVAAGIDSNNPETYLYSSRLVSLEPNDTRKFYNVRSHALAKKFNEAMNLLKEYQSSFNQARYKSLENYIRILENEENEKNAKEQEKKEKEKEKERQEEENRKRKSQQYNNEDYGSNKKTKGEDFLGYYQALGITNKNASTKDIDRAHKRKFAKASKNADEKVKEEELRKINKAQQILGDPQKKAMYDQGINPESPQGHMESSSRGRGRGYQNDFFMEEQDIGDLFKNLFGGSSGRGSGGRFYRTIYL